MVEEIFLEALMAPEYCEALEKTEALAIMNTPLLALANDL